MVKYLYDDDDEEEIYDFYDDEPYPEFIIGINEEKLMELFEEVKSGKRRKL